MKFHKYQGNFLPENFLLQFRVEYDGDDLKYIGYADPGTGEGDEEWLIVRFTYNSNKVMTKKYADGSTAFDKAWSQRNGYKYK